jgi:2-haloacid dehalogenase
MKPDPQLYRIVETASGHTSDEILFLDDRAENVEAAARLGWRTVLHQSPETTAQALKDLGLLSGGDFDHVFPAFL